MEMSDEVEWSDVHDLIVASEERDRHLFASIFEGLEPHLQIFVLKKCNLNFFRNDTYTAKSIIGEDLTPPNFRKMMNETLKEADLGSVFFKMFKELLKAGVWSNNGIVTNLLANPHLPVHVIPYFFPLRFSIYNLDLDDDALQKINERWNEVSRQLKKIPLWKSGGTRREAEAFIRYATSMTLSARRKDWKGFVETIKGIENFYIYADAIRFSTPNWRGPMGMIISSAPYEAEVLSLADEDPFILDGKCRSIDNESFISIPFSKKGKAKFIPPPPGMERILIDIINFLSKKRDKSEIRDRILGYARRASSVVGSVADPKKEDVEAIIKWLMNEPFDMLFACATNDNRISSSVTSLVTALLVISGKWEGAASVIDSFCSYSSELHDNMIDPMIVTFCIERYGGLFGNEVSPLDIVNDISEILLPDQVPCFHGTSRYRYDEGLPHKGVPPISKVGLLSPKRMNNEDYEERSCNLDVVFLSCSPRYSLSYAIKTVQQDLKMGITTNPVLLMGKIPREVIRENILPDLFCESSASVPLCEALCSLYGLRRCLNILPSEISFESIPASFIDHVVEVTERCDIDSLLPEDYKITMGEFQSCRTYQKIIDIMKTPGPFHSSRLTPVRSGIAGPANMPR